MMEFPKDLIKKIGLPPHCEECNKEFYLNNSSNLIQKQNKESLKKLN